MDKCCEKVTIKILVDPWVARLGTLVDRSDCLDALEHIEEIRVNGGGGWPKRSIVGFLREQQLDELGQTLPAHLQTAPVFHLLRNLMATKAGEAITREKCSPWDLANWHSFLDWEIRRKEWRNPVVAIPRCRSGAWQGTHIERPGNPPERRRLVPLECFLSGRELDVLMVRDFDPWLYMPPDRVLPRPKEIEEYPYCQWKAILRGIGDEQVRDGKHYLFYIPPRNWDPTKISAAKWNSVNVFPRKKYNSKYCPTDRGRRKWAWDYNERHWDVEFPPTSEWSYWRVSQTGEVIESIRHAN